MGTQCECWQDAVLELEKGESTLHSSVLLNQQWKVLDEWRSGIWGGYKSQVQALM